MVFIVVIGLLIIQVLLFLGHFWLYKTLVRFLVITNPGILLAIKISLGILSICFVIASVIAFRYYNKFTQIFYSFSAGWMGFFNFLFLALCLFWLVFAIGKIFSITLNWKYLLSFLLFAAIFLGTYGLINASNVRLTKINVLLKNMPENWKGKKAVWVSDIHLGQIRNDAFAQRLVKMINEQKPDIVFVGGDLYDGVAIDEQKMANYFSSINAPLGKYFITGNHEEFGDDTKYLAAIKNSKIKILDNEMVNINGLQLIGVDYTTATKPEDFKKILKGLQIDQTKPSILLKHTPFLLDIAEAQGINFQISGHTHKGQFPPFSWITNLVYKGYDFGFKRYGKMQIYTSSGAGTWGPPMRVGTIPEIVSITF